MSCVAQLIDAVGFHFSLQGSQTDAQHVGRVGSIPATARQAGRYQLLFELGGGLRQGGGGDLGKGFLRCRR